jgi:hypothetical protein
LVNTSIIALSIKIFNCSFTRYYKTYKSLFAKGIVNFISAQKLKIEISLFHPSINRQLPVAIPALPAGSSPEFQGSVYGVPTQASGNSFD